jgi:hypothetical protein
VSDLDELRALVRDVIRDLLPNGLPVTETVDLSTDDDLAAFVNRLLDLGPEQQEEIRSGRKRFRLASAEGRAATAPPPPAAASGSAAANGSAGMRRIERGAVTEAAVAAAARAGERLVLGRGAVLTPLARDRARASGVEIDRER